MKHIALASIVTLLAGGVAHADTTVDLFSSQSTAKKHCPADTVVWVNLASNIYHLPGTKDYGTTKKGKYACLGEVSKDAEFRAAENNQ